MRKKFNLDITTLDALTMLVHGNYGHGKTHFIGDALRSEATRGPVYFMNVCGEDGQLSINGMGVPGETIETVADYEEVLAEFRGKPLRALGVDSLKALVRLVMDTTAGGKMPEKTDYMYIHWTMERLVRQLRQAAHYVLCACPSDKSIDQLNGQTYITPDLPGREAVGSAGWFDFVGFIKADFLGPGRVVRKLTLAPSLTVVTRQRLPKAITEDITIPEKGGGWAAFLQRVEAALERNRDK